MRLRGKKFLPLTVTLLYGFLFVCVIYIYTLQREGWYEGMVEAGIAQYAGIQQEDVLIHKSMQDEGYLYTVWENTATEKLCMTILQKQQKFGHNFFRPWGGSIFDDSDPLFDIFLYQEGDGLNKQSLIVVACDNRDNALGHCELVFTESVTNGYTQEWTATIALTEPILLQARWFSGSVQCGGTIFDKEGNIAGHSRYHEDLSN